MKEKITNEGRPPTNIEVAKIAKYNEYMLTRVHKILKNDPANNKLTSIEKGRIALEFIKMNEQPENFVMLNRYLERAPQLVEEYTSSEGDMVDNDYSPLKYRKVDMGSKKDLQRSGILPKDNL